VLSALCEAEAMRHTLAVLLYGMFIALEKTRHRPICQRLCPPFSGGLVVLRARAVCLPRSERTSPAALRILL
jgi:hypothetical protein